jgi:hypothetical protein
MTKAMPSPNPDARVFLLKRPELLVKEFWQLRPSPENQFVRSVFTLKAYRSGKLPGG